MKKLGIEKIYRHETALCELFIRELKKEKNIIIYRNPECQYVPIVSFNIFGVMPEAAAQKFAELEQKIESEVEKELSDSQKEYYLREKIRLMQEELGDVNSKDSEVEKYYKKLAKLKCSKKIKDKIKREIDRYNNLNSNSPELGMIREYIEWMISLPWNIYTKDTQNLSKVKETLDQSHFALEDVKERILEYLAVKENTNTNRSFAFAA